MKWTSIFTAASLLLLTAAWAGAQTPVADDAPPPPLDASATVEQATEADSYQAEPAPWLGTASPPMHVAPVWGDTTQIWLKYPGGHLWASYCSERLHCHDCKKGCGANRCKPVRLPACQHCAGAIHRLPRTAAAPGLENCEATCERPSIMIDHEH